VASVRMELRVDACEKRARDERDGIIVSLWQCSRGMSYALDELAPMKAPTINDTGHTDSTNTNRRKEIDCAPVG
jgi:hypothetical protein